MKLPPTHIATITLNEGFFELPVHLYDPDGFNVAENFKKGLETVFTSDHVYVGIELERI